MLLLLQRDTYDPVWNEVIVVDAPYSDLKSRALQLVVVSWDRFGNNKLLGWHQERIEDLDFRAPIFNKWDTLADPEAIESVRATPFPHLLSSHSHRYIQIYKQSDIAVRVSSECAGRRLRKGLSGAQVPAGRLQVLRHNTRVRGPQTAHKRRSARCENLSFYRIHCKLYSVPI